MAAGILFVTEAGGIVTTIEIELIEVDRRRLKFKLTLHDELLTYEEVVLDMAESNRTRRMRIPAEGLVLTPQKLYLGRTAERARPRDRRRARQLLGLEGTLVALLGALLGDITVSARYLEGVTIDYVFGMHGAGFKFLNPQAKSTCGCGSSFSV